GTHPKQECVPELEQNNEGDGEGNAGEPEEASERLQGAGRAGGTLDTIRLAQVLRTWQADAVPERQPAQSERGHQEDDRPADSSGEGDEEPPTREQGESVGGDHPAAQARLVRPIQGLKIEAIARDVVGGGEHGNDEEDGGGGSGRDAGSDPEA